MKKKKIAIAMEKIKMDKPTYLISKGIVNLFENRYKLNLNDDAKKRISSLEDQFVERLGEELGTTYNYSDISPDELEKKVKESINGDKLPIINLDDVYFQNNGVKVDDYFSVTRLVQDINDFDNKIIGPRKGAKSLDDQINRLSEKYSGKDVALLDVGVFAGETLIGESGIIPLFNEKNINVKKLYVGILNTPKAKNIESKGINIVAGAEYNFNEGDWLESRDLLGFDGRKIDSKKYHINGNTQMFARYIQDPQTLKVGASINDGPTAEIVLNLCNMYQKKILREIRNEGYQVIEGFINSDPRLYTIEFRK